MRAQTRTTGTSTWKGRKQIVKPGAFAVPGFKNLDLTELEEILFSEEPEPEDEVPPDAPEDENDEDIVPGFKNLDLTELEEILFPEEPEPEDE